MPVKRTVRARKYRIEEITEERKNLKKMVERHKKEREIYERESAYFWSKYSAPRPQVFAQGGIQVRSPYVMGGMQHTKSFNHQQPAQTQKRPAMNYQPATQPNGVQFTPLHFQRLPAYQPDMRQYPEQQHNGAIPRSSSHPYQSAQFSGQKTGTFFTGPPPNFPRLAEGEERVYQNTRVQGPDVQAELVYVPDNFPRQQGGMTMEEPLYHAPRPEQPHAQFQSVQMQPQRAQGHVQSQFRQGEDESRVTNIPSQQELLDKITDEDIAEMLLQIDEQGVRFDGG
ncbi:hypothetical protein OCU04_001241 [Sclerotinia nivalis]|uniref:Uncharacterized protein n=1 Tax=Sclerotinia nivalis TaxID=352851 RepID=A0A9X0AXS6_9HELO|nr:hypothetical protein OCU04_001241 [Sclerotinia nivalis]